MNLFNDIQGKALLYAVPLFLAPFIDKIVPVLYGGATPTIQQCIGCGLVGIASMCIGLRAFYDGSYERRKSGSDSADLRTGDTQFVQRTPTPPPAA